MKCEVCGRGPADGTTIYRTTPKGQAPHWRCERHLDPSRHPAPDKGTMEIARMFENDSRHTAGKGGK
jgi:hypothetical protein